MVNCENENGLARLFLSEAVSVAGGGNARVRHRGDVDGDCFPGGDEIDCG